MPGFATLQPYSLNFPKYNFPNLDDVFAQVAAAYRSNKTGELIGQGIGAAGAAIGGGISQSVKNSAAQDEAELQKKLVEAKIAALGKGAQPVLPATYANPPLTDWDKMGDPTGTATQPTAAPLANPSLDLNVPPMTLEQPLKTANGSVFGLVPDGKGGYKSDPNDITDANVPGFDPNRGAGGANIKDPTLMGAGITPKELRAAGGDPKDLSTHVVEATANGKTLQLPIVDLLGKKDRIDFTLPAYRALGGPEERNGGLIKDVQYRVVPKREVIPLATGAKAVLQDGQVIGVADPKGPLDKTGAFTGGKLRAPHPTEVALLSPKTKDAETEIQNKINEKLALGGYDVSSMSPEQKRAALNKRSEATNSAEIIANAIIEGKQPPTLTNMRNQTAAVREALAVRGYDLSHAQEDWDATKRHLATLNGPQQMRVRQALDFTKHSLDIIDDLNDEWKAGNYPLLNKGQLLLAKQGLLGPEANSLAQRLEAQINDLVSELGTVYKGGTASTDQTLRLAAESLKADFSEKTLRDSVALVRRNLQVRQNSLNSTTAAGVSSDSPYAPKGESTKESSAAGPAKEKFEVGKKYRDSKGRWAKYLGDGKWEEVK